PLVGAVPARSAEGLRDLPRAHAFDGGEQGLRGHVADTRQEGREELAVAGARLEAEALRLAEGVAGTAVPVTLRAHVVVEMRALVGVVGVGERLRAAEREQGYEGDGQYA